MNHIKKFGESLNEKFGELRFPGKSVNSKLDAFYKEYKKIFDDNEEYEQGDEPSNTDLIDMLGDLLNKYDMSKEDIKYVLDNYDCHFDINYFLKYEYEEWDKNNSDPKKEKLLKIIQGYIGMKPRDKGFNNWSEMQEKMADEIIEIIK